MDCLFCKIVGGEIPAERVAESTNFLAFLDVAPVTPGHTLIVPKGHATNLLELHEALGNELVAFTQRVAQALVAATAASGFNVVMNNGTCAGQAVPHAHLHVIPRKEGDGISVRVGSNHRSTPEERKAIRVRIIESIGSTKSS